MAAEVHYLPSRDYQPPASLPADISVEQAVLGSVLVNNSLLDRIPWLTPDDFYEPVHARIFTSILARHALGELADPLTVKRLFDDDPALKELDGAKYLARMARAAESIGNGVHYAKIVKRLARRRAIIETAEEMAKRAREDEDADPAEILASADRKLDVIASDPTRQASQPISAVVAEICRLVENPPQIWRTGLDALDKSLGGGVPEGYVLGIEARMKQFKTGTIHTLMMALARTGVPALYFACEMGSVRLARRMLGHAGGFNSGMFRYRDRTLLDKIESARTALPDCIDMVDTPGLTFGRLRALASEHVMRRGTRVFVLDYWQLVRPDKPVRNMSEHLVDVAQWCADFAKQHSVTWLIASQENREGFSRGSDGLAMACDWFATLHKHEKRMLMNSLGLVETLWFDVKYSRDGTGEPLGGPEEPAFFIHPHGPHLAEVPRP